MKLAFALSVLCLFASLPMEAQRFRVHQYRVADGLPSDFTKDITEDSLGYIWVATDYGLARLDGGNPSAYNPQLHSRYMKKFLTTRDGDILVVGDQDLLSVSSRPDTATFHSLAVGTQSPTDSTVWFPKTIFEDQTGNLWLGEPQAISRFNKKGIKRYHFPIEDRTTIFIRSFSFFLSPDNQLYAVSYPGRLFRFNPVLDAFERVDVKLPSGISVVIRHDNTVWFGAENGLYAASFMSKNLSEPKKIFDAQLVSCLLIESDALWLGTYRGELFHFNLKQPTNLTPNLSLHFDVINNMYKSAAGDYWLATDRGVVLLQPSAIQEISSSSGLYVQAVTEDPSAKVTYFSIKEELYKLTPTANGWSSKTVYASPLGYFQGIAARDGKVWAANAFSVLYFENDKLKAQWDFSNRGQFVHEVWLDQANRFWFCQDGNDSVTVIDENKLIQTYHVPIKTGSNIIAVREGRGGMYVISNNTEAYLFFKASSQPHFSDISLPIDFEKDIELGLTDLATQGDTVWLATAKGLLLYAGKSVRPIDLGARYNHHAITVVEVLDRDHLLFGNVFGLFLYNIRSGEYWLYDEHAGLPANTITPRNIVVDQSKQIWVGTSSGLAYLKNEIEVNLSPMPGIRHIYVNGVRVPFQRELHVPYNAFVSLGITAPIYPREMTLLEWRMDGGSWKSVADFEISLSSLPVGVTRIEVRALKTGWQSSSLLTLPITVEKPIWMTTWFFGLVILVLLIITIITVWITQLIQSKQQRALEKLIDDRTFELNQRNQELDRFVYSASHDLSAPLRSMLGLINLARIGKPTEEQQQYLGLMEQSVLKLQGFINEVVNYSRNSRLPAKIEPVHFKSLVESILDDHRFAPGFDRIRFVIEDSLTAPAKLDLLRFKIILNNLISNAIKFHWPGDDRQPTVIVKIENASNGNLSATVSDNGRGIKKEHLDKLFDMFYRATPDAPGSGLGLYILKESVRKMSGDVRVESTWGAGTTFFVTLPNQA